MHLQTTVNNATGKARYYVDGVRVTKRVMEGIKRDHELDTFYGHTHRGYTRRCCHARKEKGYDAV